MADLFNVRWEHDVTVVTCSGPIVFGGEAADLSTNLRNLMERGRRVVVDLAGVTRLDSYGIGVLFGIYTSAVTAGATLVLSGVTNHVRKALVQASMVPLVAVYGSDSEAVQALTLEEALTERHH